MIIPTYLPTCFQFNGHFTSNPGSAGPSSLFFLHMFLKRTFGDKWHRFFMGCMSFSMKALKETQICEADQWPGLILSSSTTGLLMERALLPSSQLSSTSTKSHNNNNCNLRSRFWHVCVGFFSSREELEFTGLCLHSVNLSQRD